MLLPRVDRQHLQQADAAPTGPSRRALLDDVVRPTGERTGLGEGCSAASRATWRAHSTFVLGSRKSRMRGVFAEAEGVILEDARADVTR